MSRGPVKLRAALSFFLSLMSFLSLLSFSFSCSSPKPSHDADTVTPDGDIITTETETIVPDDFDDAVPVENEGNILDDALVSDADNADCPPLISAPFPYYKEDGTIHFCRKCDTPTEKDPQCVQNLWKEANQKLTHDYPDADCYPYPCEMSNLKPMTKAEVEAVYTTYSMHECDLMLANYGWDTDSTGGQIKHWNLSGGKVGFVMYKVNIDITQYVNARKFFVYDLSSKEYTAVSAGDYGFAYHTGHALGYLRDNRSLDLATTYMYVGYFSTDGTYRVVFNKPIYSIVYTPALNDDWAFANITFQKGGVSTMYYAKVGEWKWTSLGEGVGNHPDLYGDLLAFYDDNVKGHVCNLSKAPKSLSDCTTVNRVTEEVRDIQFDRDHPDIFYYSRDFNQAITRVDMSAGAGQRVYEDIITDFSDATKGVAYSLVVEQVKNNTILYLEIEDISGEGGGLACFYRTDLKKRYCMKKMEKDPQYGEWVDFPYGHSEFEGDWFLYQKHANSPLILRDMKCYCEKEGICPFEGMTR